MRIDIFMDIRSICILICKCVYLYMCIYIHARGVPQRERQDKQRGREKRETHGCVLRQMRGRNLATEMKRARLSTSVLGYRPDFSSPLK